MYQRLADMVRVLDRDIELLKTRCECLDAKGGSFKSAQARLEAIARDNIVRRDLRRVQKRRDDAVVWLQGQLEEVTTPAPYAYKGTDITP